MQTVHHRRFNALKGFEYFDHTTYNDRIAAVEKQTKDIRKELDAQKQIVDLDTQAKCSNAAKAFFMANWHRDYYTTLLDYSNHYNRSLGRCFIFVEWRYIVPATKPTDWFNEITIHDAYENNKYAELMIHLISPQDDVIHCDVEGQTCKSAEEFKQRIRHYMVD